MKTILAITTVAFLAVQPAHAADNTVDFYMSNTAARERTLIRCAKNPAELDKTRDCITAKAAAQRIKFSHQGVAKIRKPGGERYTGKTF